MRSSPPPLPWLRATASFSCWSNVCWVSTASGFRVSPDVSILESRVTCMGGRCLKAGSCVTVQAAETAIDKQYNDCRIVRRIPRPVRKQYVHGRLTPTMAAVANIRKQEWPITLGAGAATCAKGESRPPGLFRVPAKRRTLTRAGTVPHADWNCRYGCPHSYPRWRGPARPGCARS